MARVGSTARGYQGSIHTPWQHPPSMAQPRVPGQHPPPIARGSITEWGQRGHPCGSRLGPSQAVLFHPWMSWSLSSLRPVLLCPAHISAKLSSCQTHWEGLWGPPGHAGPPLCPALQQGWTHRVSLGFASLPGVWGQAFPCPPLILGFYSEVQQAELTARGSEALARFGFLLGVSILQLLL